MSSPAERVRVSVVVQAYNTARYIEECLDSVLRQRTSFAFDVTVIDDASTDGTAAAAARYTGQGVSVVRHETNRGAVATAGEGYAAARGDFVLRLDSDDRLRPDFIERAASALERWPGAGLVYGDIGFIDDIGRPAGERRLNPVGGDTCRDELLPLLIENYIPAPATMVRRSALAPLLPIPAELSFVDWYVTTGIAERWHCAHVDGVLADYRVHGESMHHTMVRDRTGETSSQRILDRLFANEHRVDEKRAWQHLVYAAHYLTYAEKYFGSHMNADARRCYRLAFTHSPRMVLQRGAMRRWAVSNGSRPLYEAAKDSLRRSGLLSGSTDTNQR